MFDKPKLETREQALKYIQGKIFAATLLGIMDMTIRGPKPEESGDEFAKRQAADMELRNEKLAKEIFDAVIGLAANGGGQTEPANDEGEEKALQAMAGDSHGGPGPAVAAFLLKRKDVPERMTAQKTGAAILQDELDGLVKNATDFMERQHREAMKRLGDDIKRIVVGLKVNKTA